MTPPPSRPASPGEPLPPFDSLGRARRGAGPRVLAWHIARTLVRLGFLGAAAVVVGEIVMGGMPQPWQIAAVPVLLLLAALAGLAADRAQAAAESAIATSLRAQAGDRLAAMTARQVQAVPVGQLVVSMARYPDAVAGLVVGHRTARTMMAAGPVLAAAALAAVSWQAALTVLALTPVMILFFALVGDAIRKRAQAQERAFGHLAGQFADRIRTLPTILANDALAGEERKLAERLRAYAGKTMGVLRIAFLNAGIIDFFASLSIAMLAVFLGLGHLGLASLPGFSGLELWQSLFILMIAPDYFAPFRRFAEQYHAKAEGEAAAAALDAMLSPAPAFLDLPAAVDARQALGSLPGSGLIAVTGPSGAGKTTLLRQLAGVDEPEKAAAISWISTDCFVPQGSLRDAIVWNDQTRDRADIEQAAELVGLLNEAWLPAGLDTAVAPGGANLSGGQKLRIAVARALLSGRIVLADEPTAKLDPVNAVRVRNALLGIAETRLVVVATHDPELARLASRTIALSPTRETTEPA